MFKTNSKQTLTLLACFLMLILLVYTGQHAKATITINVDAYDINHATYVVTAFSLDGVGYGNTPQSISGLSETHWLNIALTDTYSNNFQGWLYHGILTIDNYFLINEFDPGIDGSDVVALYSSAVPPNIPNITPNGTRGTGNYTFTGLNDETTGMLTGGVYVTAHFNIPNTYPQRFYVNGTFGYNTTSTPMYFSYDLGNNNTREYWLSKNESTASLYVLNSTNLTNVNFLFYDSTNALTSYDMCSAQRYINGSLVTVDKRKIDITKQVVLYVKAYTLYNILVSDGLNYTFGDVNTLSSTVDLTIKGIDFPPDVVLANQYIRLWGYRNIGAITIKYLDTQSKTTSVAFQIKYTNGTSAYSSTHTGENSFEDTWSSALDNVTYYMDATIKTSYGTMTLSKTFSGSLGGVPPWSLAFLGLFPAGIDSSQLIPAVIILFVFGIFSVLNGYLGAFFGTVVYAFMAYMGWMNVNAGLIVAGLAIAFILGITFAKRRLIT